MKKTGFVLILSVLFIGLGCLLGQYGAVMEKAVRICMECVGIG